MGYNLHISRGAPYGETFKPIAIDEWNKAIEEKEELKRIEAMEGKNPTTGEVIHVSLKDSAEFRITEKKLFGTKEYGALLSFGDGYLSTRYPEDKKTVESLRIVASWFSAELYGEEGEQV